MLIPDQYLHGKKGTCENRGKKMRQAIFVGLEIAWLKQIKENHSQPQSQMKLSAGDPCFG